MKLVNTRVETTEFRRALKLALALCALLWLMLVLDGVFNLHLYRLAVYPRDPQHLFGILFSPLVHGSFEHLVGNTLPLLILMTASFWRYPRASRWVMPVVWVLSGIGIWLFGRGAYHYGASGLTHGLMFFTFVSGILRKDRAATAIALGVFFLYGTMIWGVFPADPSISYESHLFGAMAGVLMAVFLRNMDRPAQPEVDDWYLDEEDDPVIGDQWKTGSEPEVPVVEGDDQDYPLRG